MAREYYHQARRPKPGRCFLPQTSEQRGASPHPEEKQPGRVTKKTTERALSVTAPGSTNFLFLRKGIAPPHSTHSHLLTRDRMVFPTPRTVTVYGEANVNTARYARCFCKLLKFRTVTGYDTSGFLKPKSRVRCIFHFLFRSMHFILLTKRMGPVSCGLEVAIPKLAPHRVPGNHTASHTFLQDREH